MTARKHVLIVEDDANASGALRLLFEETGRRVSLAHTVASAITMAGDDPPDLLLLDLTLPDGSGLEVLGALRSRGVSAGAAVALTGHDDDDTIAQCHDAGCLAVLTKPVPIRELLRRTEEWLGG